MGTLSIFLILILFLLEHKYARANENLNQNSLYKRLSSHKTQVNVIFNDLFSNTISLKNWKNINDTQLQETLGKIENVTVPSVIQELQIKDLNLILDSTLNSKVEVSCVGPNKLIKSKFISIKKVLSKNYLRNDCPSSQNGQPKSIALFALNTIFIDTDIYRSGERLTLIAPNWEVIGNRTIDLSGYDANPNEEETIDCKVHPGEDGEPGSAGGPGGHFWGIGDKFINGQNLKVIANGGKGGPGKNGCPGVNGENGEILPFEQGKCSEYWKNKNLTEHRKTCACIRVWYKTKYTTRYYTCNFSGSPGEKGKTGGDGGRGGNGGKHGLIEMVELGKKSGIYMQTSLGEKGTDGIGGVGGFGGMHGDDRFFKCDTHKDPHCEETPKSNPKQAPKGDSGLNGTNVIDMPVPKEFKQIFRPIDIVNEYKYFLHTNLENYVESNTLKSFYDSLDNSYMINNKYDLLGFFKEQERLEKEHYLLNIGADFKPFFESLDRKIKNYSETNLESKEKLELHDLLELIAERLEDLNGDNFTLITNIRETLNSLDKKAHELKNHLSEKSKLNILHKQQTNYITNLNSKLEDANEKIEKFLNVKIKRIFKNIDKAINDLIENVTKLIQLNIREGKQIEEKREKLKGMLLLKGVFDIVDFVGKSVSLFGSYGAVAGGITQMLGTELRRVFVNETVFDLPHSFEVAPEITKNVNNSRDLLTKIGEKRISEYTKLAGDIEKEIENNQDVFESDTKDKIIKMRKRLNEVELEIKKSYNLTVIKEFKKEYEPVLSVMKETINSKDDIPNKSNLSRSLDLYTKRFTRASSVGKEATDLFDKFKNNSASQDEITQAILKNHQQRQDLEKYQTSIYKTLSPMVNKFQDEISDLQYEFSVAKSKATLITLIDQLNSNLNGIQKNIEKMTNGFKKEAETFKDHINDLKASMNTLGEVYKYMQDNQKDQEFANITFNQNIVLVSSFSANDLEIGEAMLNVETLKQSNTLVERYERSVNTMKMFFFPFHDDYLQKIALPPSLTFADNLNNKANDVIDQIESILKKLEKVGGNILKYGYNTRFDQFNSDKTIPNPFFVWKNNDFKDEIVKLLSGEKALLDADIKKSGINHDMVKFKEINLKFKTKNVSLQPRMNDALKAVGIEMKHSGDCYYRFNGNITAIPSINFTILYNFETNADDKELSNKNSDYYTIKEGDYVLSPYGTWEVQLSGTKTAFDALLSFKDEVYLELTGKASHLSKKRLK